MGMLAPPPGPPVAEKKPEPKKGTLSLFGGSPKSAAGPQAPTAPDINKEMSGLGRRLRVLEERFENLRKKIQLVEGNMLDTTKKVKVEIKTSSSDILDMKAEFKDMQSNIMLLIKELKLLAKKEDVDIIKKYMEFWQPLKFVTQTQVEKIVKEILEEKQQNF